MASQILATWAQESLFFSDHFNFFSHLWPFDWNKGSI